MAANQESERDGILRLQMSGGWGVAELGSYLSLLDEAYRLAATLSLLVAEPELPFNYGWPGLITVRGDYPERTVFPWSSVPPEMTEIKALAGARAGLLRVHSFQLESPGWLEVLGALQPLRIIADSIARWRSENTERRRLLHAFQLQLLSRLPPAVQARYAAGLLEQTMADTQRLAIDVRVSEVSVSDAPPERRE